MARLGDLPSQILPPFAIFRNLSHLLAAPEAPWGLCTPHHRAQMYVRDTAIRLQTSSAAIENVSAVAYRTGTPWLPRQPGSRMSHVPARSQRCQCRLSRAKISLVPALELHLCAETMARLGDLPSQILPPFAIFRNLSHLLAAPVALLGLGRPCHRA